MSCSSKIVVFDLDETLGYFMELGMFWDALKSYINNTNLQLQINQSLFDNILHLYPEFLRPNVINILNYIKKKKELNQCYKLMIYTNNQGPLEWAKHITTYFETQINAKIFDQIIAAFTVQGKRVEICRTTHLKTHIDLIKCTKMPENTHICFLDDAFYPDMANQNIYYINVKPYIYDLEYKEMLHRFITSDIIKGYDLNIREFKDFMLKFLDRYNHIYINKTNESQIIDKIVSKKILQHLHKFFKLKLLENNNLNKTKRRDKILKNKTLKK
jgi:hypothetical protein